MNKKFWKTFKPFFSNSYTLPEKMIIVEKGEVLTDDISIAECMNQYFVNVTKTLDIKEWPDPQPLLQTDDTVSAAILHKYKNHPSIQMIKSAYGENANKFEFQHILPETVYKQVKQLDESKSASGDIPTKIIK